MMVKGTQTMRASFMNALRESVMTGVPTLAIDSVRVELNLSLLDDFSLQATLGMIPLAYPRALVQKMTFVDECEGDKCTGSCPQCSIPFRMDVSFALFSGEKGEAKEKKAELVRVQAKHIQIQSDTCRVAPEAMEQFITYLSQDQVIRVSGYIHKSQFDDQEHANFYPLSNTPALRAIHPRIVLDTNLAQQLSPQAKRDLVQSCPRRVLDIEDTDVVVKRPLNCTQCHACVDWANDFVEQKKLIQVLDTPPYEFLIEAKPSHSAAELFQEALATFRRDLTRIRYFCIAQASSFSLPLTRQ